MAAEPTRPDPAAAACPLCGAANDCGVAAGRDECWCFNAAIPSAVLARVPEEDRDRRCVCPRCAGVDTKNRNAGGAGAPPGN